MRRPTGLLLSALLVGCATQSTPTEAPPVQEPDEAPSASPVTRSAPQAEATPTAFPAERAAGRLRVLDLRPTSEIGEAALQELLSRLGACVESSPPACGYRVFSVEVDRHGTSPSMSTYADTLDGEASDCIVREAQRLRRTPEQDPAWQYRAAVAVAPSAAEMVGCADGSQPAVERWVRRSQPAP